MASIWRRLLHQSSSLLVPDAVRPGSSSIRSKRLGLSWCCTQKLYRYCSIQKLAKISKRPHLKISWERVEGIIQILPFKHSWAGLNPLPNKPWFLCVCSTSLLKTLWEKEKLLVTSNFSFSHSVFYPFGELSAIFIKIKIVICKHFQFGKSLKFVIWERVKCAK